MKQPQCEVADVFRTSWDSYVRNRSVTSLQHKVARDIMSCRTAALGGHRYKCVDCGAIEQSYNSCRNRHCPRCQGRDAAKWVDERSAELLPVPYFHTVFTLPEHFNSLVLQNRKLVYELLFRATKETLLEVGRNNLGCKLGFFAVLHTWGQLMQLHPHVHCVIPACGIAQNGEVKVFSERYLLPVRVLSAVFRGKFIGFLKREHREKRLFLRGELQPLEDLNTFENYLSGSVRTDWVVYSQPPFAGPETVVKYLARYTYRIAISNSRLIEIKDTRVFFRYKDYKDEASEKVTSLSCGEFIRRFLSHVVDKGFVRVRHYGFLSHSNKKKSLSKIRAELRCGTPISDKPALNPHREHVCTCCGGTSWFHIGEVPPVINILPQPPPFLVPDSRIPFP